MTERVAEQQPGWAVVRGERRDALEHRQHILDAARQLFAERGVEGTSMHQIAQAAGVGQGTLYRRYGHKGELCMDLLEESGRRFLAEIDALRAADAEPASALARLQLVMEHITLFIEEKGQYLSAMRDSYCGGRRADMYTSPFYRPLHALVSALFTEAAEQGELRPGDAGYAADALLAVFNPDLYLFQRHDRGLSRGEILAGARRLFIEGLRP